MASGRKRTSSRFIAARLLRSGKYGVEVGVDFVETHVWTRILERTANTIANSIQAFGVFETLALPYTDRVVNGLGQGLGRWRGSRSERERERRDRDARREHHATKQQ